MSLVRRAQAAKCSFSDKSDERRRLQEGSSVGILTFPSSIVCSKPRAPELCHKQQLQAASGPRRSYFSKY